MAFPLYASAYDRLGYFSSQKKCRKVHSATLYPLLLFGSKARMTRQGHNPRDGTLPYEIKASSWTESRIHEVNSHPLDTGMGGHDD